MDPWMMGLLSMFASQNPGQAGPMMDKLGIPPPGSGSPIGGDSGDAGLGPWMTTVNPEPQPGAAASAKPSAQSLMQLASLQGIKPPAPVTPIMGGGVAGGVKPPDTAKSLQAGSPAINALMAALLHPGNQDPLRVPTLGSFIRGGKY